MAARTDVAATTRWYRGARKGCTRVVDAFRVDALDGGDPEASVAGLGSMRDRLWLLGRARAFMGRVSVLARQHVLQRRVDVADSRAAACPIASGAEPENDVAPHSSGRCGWSTDRPDTPGRIVWQRWTRPPARGSNDRHGSRAISGAGGAGRRCHQLVWRNMTIQSPDGAPNVP